PYHDFGHRHARGLPLMDVAGRTPSDSPKPPLTLVTELAQGGGAESSQALAAVTASGPPPVKGALPKDALAAQTAPAESASAPAKWAYPAAAELPTQEGPKGLRFDFNDGARVLLPEAEHPW